GGRGGAGPKAASRVAPRGGTRATAPGRARCARASANASGSPASFLLFLLIFFREHFLEQGGADVFEAIDGLYDRGLVFEGKSAFDVTQLFRHFSNIDLDILWALPGLGDGVASFLGVGNDVLNGGAGLVDLAIAVELVGIADLILCDPDGEIGTVLGTRAFEACFELVHGFILGRAVRAGKGKGNGEHKKGQAAHGAQRFFGSMAIRRWVACHS